MATLTSDNGGLAVRPAIADDGAVVWHLWLALQALHAEADPTNYRPAADQAGFQDYFKSVLLGDEWDPLVAERNGKVVGYIVLREIEREPDLLHCARHWLEIEHLSVAEGERRMGVATALLEQARLVARRRGIHRLKVGVRAFNAPAVEAYKRLGFEHAFHRMNLVLNHERDD